MKRLAKNIWISRPDKYQYELFHLVRIKDDDGHFKTDDEGKIKERKTVIGYYSNFDRVWKKIEDLGMTEYINGDINDCKSLIDEASKNLKEYINETR